MAVLTKAQIAALSTEERLALIDELWDSLEPPVAPHATNGAPIPEWHREILDERLADLEESPEKEISLAEAGKHSLL